MSSYPGADLIDGGTAEGLEAGENLAVRRRPHDRQDQRLRHQHTAGMLQMVTREHVSSAVVVYACDVLMRDYLASFQAGAGADSDPSASPPTTPRRSSLRDSDCWARRSF